MARRLRKASEFVSTLNTTQKIALSGGSSSTDNVTSPKFSDSAAGPAGYYWVTAWPAGLAMAITWDKDAIYEEGQLQGA